MKMRHEDWVSLFLFLAFANVLCLVLLCLVAWMVER